MAAVRRSASGEVNVGVVRVLTSSSLSRSAQLSLAPLTPLPPRMIDVVVASVDWLPLLPSTSDLAVDSGRLSTSGLTYTAAFIASGLSATDGTLAATAVSTRECRPVLAQFAIKINQRSITSYTVLISKTSQFKTVCKDDSGYVAQLEQQKSRR